MVPLPERRTETHFSDYKAAWNLDQAMAEANRCLYCFDGPCKGKCPSAVDVPEFVHRIATGNLRSAAAMVLADNPLGMSCARVCPVEVLCGGACVLPNMGLPAIQIGRLQRFVTDLALDNDWSFVARAPATGKRVALVGGGPASLACAWYLGLQGHQPVIFEKDRLPGGLNTTAIAPYKLKAVRAVEEAEYLVRHSGTDLRLGVEAGVDVTWESLEQDFDAVFIGVGLGPDRLMGRLPGADLPGIEGAVEFIGQIKTREIDLRGVERAVVVGGGNTAVDLTRELLTLGVPVVTLIYRRDQASMKGYQHEWEVAVKGGAKAHWRTTPVGFSGTGRVDGVRCSRLSVDLIPIDGSDFVVPADRVFVAIGQSRLGDLLQHVSGIEAPMGLVVIDSEGATGRPGWYAGGDCVNGGKEVVNAAADGKTAARAIHRYLTQA
ncbi:MAG: FAD-dependent oxidoreductase [Pseudomonadota bacterium]